MSVASLLALTSLAVAVVLLGVGPSMPAAGNQCKLTGSSLTELGARASMDERVAPGVMHPVSARGSKYLRARLSVEEPVGSGWFLTIRDMSFRPIQTLAAEDFRAPRRSPWTERVSGDTVWLDLDVLPGSPVPVVRVLEYIAMPAEANKPTYYTVLNPTAGPQFRALFDARVPTVTRRWGDPVGLLLSSWNTSSWCCSGVLISSDLFLTNWHCGGAAGFLAAGYWNDDVCADTTIDLSWDGNQLSREFACERVELKDEIRDFAILRIRPLEHRGTPRPAPLRLGPPAVGPVSVIHHPACRPKQLTDACAIVEVDRPAWQGGVPSIDVGHKCDTEGGSSGAPIFNARGEVVALHHHGLAVDQASCTYSDAVNKAVRIDAIIDFVRTHRPDLLKGLMVR